MCWSFIRIAMECLPTDSGVKRAMYASFVGVILEGRTLPLGAVGIT